VANPGSPGKMAVKTECVCVHVCHWFLTQRTRNCSLLDAAWSFWKI